MTSFRFRQVGPVSLGCLVEINEKKTPISSFSIRGKVGEIPQIQIGFFQKDKEILTEWKNIDNAEVEMYGIPNKAIQLIEGEQMI